MERPVLLGLGANVGDALATLAAAVGYYVEHEPRYEEPGDDQGVDAIVDEATGETVPRPPPSGASFPLHIDWSPYDRVGVVNAVP